VRKEEKRRRRVFFFFFFCARSRGEKDQSAEVVGCVGGLLSNFQTQELQEGIEPDSMPWGEKRKLAGLEGEAGGRERREKSEERRAISQ